MKNLLVSLIIFSANLVFCQGGVFREKEVIKYTVKYETAAFVRYDTIMIFVTGKMWKAAPNTSKEIVILSLTKISVLSNWTTHSTMELKLH